MRRSACALHRAFCSLGARGARVDTEHGGELEARAARMSAAVTPRPLRREPAALAPARERWSWALYYFANTIFSMNVATYYFNVWLIGDLGSSSTKVTLGNTLSSALVAISIPFFGAISDAR